MAQLRMKEFRALWLAATAFLLASLAQANVSLQVEVDTHVEAGKGAQNVPTDASSSLEVILADRYFVVKSAKLTNVYDFDKRKRVVIDTEHKTRVDYSLFDTVGFRVIEFRNREYLGKMLAGLKVGEKAMATIDNEHVLAVQVKPSNPLQVKTEDAGETYLNDGRILFRRLEPSTSVSPGDARMFTQFVRYTFGGHPQILNALTDKDSIPSRMVLITNDGRLTTRTITIKSVQPGDKAQIDITAFPLRDASASTDPVDAALDRAAAITEVELTAARQRTKDELVVAFADGHVLDGFLRSLEWSLMTGENLLPPPNSEKAALLLKDESVRKLGIALSANTKETLTDAVKVIAELRSSAATKGYVLKIFEANDRAMLGDRQAARQLFVEALSVNPYMASAYKDFGDVLVGEFDAARAWRSWDIGRKIAPRFPNFEAVNQFERSLESEHPEYF
jgi:hypothetical protein